ncbi:hypothetical protein ACVIIV_004945 [Bradyrhizobium sp. USDA 4354]
MLVAIDRQWTLLDEAGADAVGALMLLAPERAGPQAPGLERRIVRRRAAAIDRHALAVGEQHAAARGADGLIKPVHRALRGGQKRRDALARLVQLGFGQPHWGGAAAGIEMM